MEEPKVLLDSELGPGNYKETQATGRQVDYQYMILEIGRYITQVKARNDIYNTAKAYNIVSSLVDHLEGTLSPYADVEYKQDIDTLKEEAENIDSGILTNIEYLKERYAAVMRLCKRKGFLPPDDVMTNSWVIVNELVQAIKADNDGSILVEGKKGCGKSTVAIALCQEISLAQKLPFSLKTNVFKDANKLREHITATNPPRGTCFVYDDAGADDSMNKRRTNTLESIEWNAILQTCRDLGYIIFYTSPSENYITGPALGLFTHKLEPRAKLENERITLVKFKVGQEGKKGRLWIYKKNPSGERITTIRVQIPSEEVIAEYKIFRRELSMDKIKTKSRRKIEEKEAARFKPFVNAKIIVDEGADKFRTKYKNRLGKINTTLIEQRFENEPAPLGPVGGLRAKRVKQAVEELLKQKVNEFLKEDESKGKEAITDVSQP